MAVRRRPKRDSNKVAFGKATLIGHRKRVQSKVTPEIKRIAKRFPGNDIKTVKEIARFVFESTQVKETVWPQSKRFKRSAEKVLQNHYVDLIHCYDRCHAMLSILAAKKIPSWIVVELDWQGFVHTYVETTIGNELYTIAFRTFEEPLVLRGRVEKAVRHAPGSNFTRGLDMGDLGVLDPARLKKLIQQMEAGKPPGSIELKG